MTTVHPWFVDIAWYGFTSDKYSKQKHSLLCRKYVVEAGGANNSIAR